MWIARKNRIILLATVLVICIPAAAVRKDTVVMKNGDRLTGTVKKLESGVLYLETDYFSGSVGLDWLQVEEIQSSGGFQVTLTDGRRIAGTIEKVPETAAPGGDFQIQARSGNVRTPALNVISIESQKPNFWRQLKGSIDVGTNFTSGNSQASLSSDANATYETTKWTVGASFTSSFSGQSGGSTTNLIEVQSLDTYLVRRNSFLLGLADFLHSSQQDLDLRTTLAGGYGRFLVRTNHNELAWLGGVAFTQENFTSNVGKPATQNVEGLLGAEYQLFHFTRYSLQSQLLVYPGLSDAGRVRMTTKTSFTVKLVNNFHTDFSFWDNFDSRPPFNSKGNELGVSNSLGWTF